MRLTSFAVVIAPLVVTLTMLTAHAQAQTPTTPPAEAPEPAPAEPAAKPQGAAASPAEAAHEGAAPAEEVEEDRSVYLSISPIHLILPFVELTGEIRLHRKIGASIVGGYGAIKVDGVPERFKAWEVGGQFVGYPVGHFDHGMQLGVEVLYAGVSGNDNSNVKIAATANGLAAGPFVGYKLATKVGFSFNVQGGFEYMLVRADAASSNGATASASESRIIPLVNLNVGWSF